MSLIGRAEASSITDSTPSTVLTTNDNTTLNSVIADPDSFITPTIDNELSAPEIDYSGGDFISNSANQPSIIHNSGVVIDYKIEFSGTIVAGGIGLIGSFVGLKVLSSSGQVFTGGLRFFELGVSPSGVSARVGFYLPIYGRIAANESLTLQLSSNSSGDLTLSDLLVFSTRLRPAR